ncbi:hypothetical protein M885DRAFT_539762 [Pelagophyceae sp. CCMP2097]|nr:hypothetical protein M885DRAFT_539762 [Pelagophyceae sp. CCMP2097]
MGFSKIGNFLNKKPWHPTNIRNQEMIWKAEEKSRKDEQALEEYRARITIERDAEELQQVAKGGFVMSQETLREKRKAEVLRQGAAAGPDADDEALAALDPARRAALRDRDEKAAKAAAEKVAREQRKKDETLARNANKRRRKKESKQRKESEHEAEAAATPAHDAAATLETAQPGPTSGEAPAAPQICNDGSFLEMIKAQMSKAPQGS